MKRSSKNISVIAEKFFVLMNHQDWLETFFVECYDEAEAYDIASREEAENNCWCSVVEELPKNNGKPYHQIF